MRRSLAFPLSLILGLTSMVVPVPSQAQLSMSAVPPRVSTSIVTHPLDEFALHSNQTSPAKAVVLEPFADELRLGPDAGSRVAAALTNAGFEVTVLRNEQVTVPIMEHLNNYSVIYMEAHSAVLPDGDAVILTGETNPSPYADLYKEGSLVQAFADSGSNGQLYNGVTGKFFAKHVGLFPNSSLFIIEGCSVLAASRFWAQLQQRNVRALVGWDQEVPQWAVDGADSVVVPALSGGASVASAIAAANYQGLEYRGDGEESLVWARSMATAVPTAAPAAIPTSTMVALTPTKLIKVARKKHPVKKAACGKKSKRKCKRRG